MFSKWTYRKSTPRQSNWLESNDQSKDKSFIPPIQTKLNIGKPGDVYEKEADKTADDVVNNTAEQSNIQKMGEEKEDVQAKGTTENITPFVQKMGEEKEDVQSKEEEEVQAKCDNCAKEEAVQKFEEEPVQAKEEEEVTQGKEEEEPVQAKEEEEVAHGNEKEEPVQAKEEEEVAQGKEEEEPAQAKEEEEVAQGKEEEEPAQAKEEEEVAQGKEEEEPAQAKEEEEVAQGKEEEEPAQAKEEEEAAQGKEEEEPMQAKEEEKETQQSADNKSKKSESIERKLGAHRGGGHLMDEETQGEMEKSFGNDFSNVRIHTGGYAQDMNKELKAKAFTNGNDIYFNSSQYDPQSESGKRLLAHELTHTIQQKGPINKDVQAQDGAPAPAAAVQQLKTDIQALITANNRSYNAYKTLIQAATAGQRQFALNTSRLLTDLKARLSWNNWARCIELLGRQIPSGNTMRSNATVRAAMQTAWNASNPAVTRWSRPHPRHHLAAQCNPIANQPPTTAHEEGGFIYLNLITGNLSTRTVPRGRQATLPLANPPTVANSVVVGAYHTHPNVGQCWGRPRFGTADRTWTTTQGVPLLMIGAHPGITDTSYHQTGNSRRHLAGNRGVPGPSGGLAP